MSSTVHKAIILAAGRGTRMRQPAPGATLTPAQKRAADEGHKALMPVPRPFLDYQIAALARAGIGEVCVVVAPHQAALRDHVQALSGIRVRTEIVYQEQALGTAHAVLAAETFTAPLSGPLSGPFSGQDSFLLLNSDNYYPPSLLRSLCALEGPGLVALDRTRTLESRWGNLSDAKLSTYAVVTTSSEGCLAAMVEKPPRHLWESLPEPVLVNINAWRFDSSIFAGCRAVEPSERGEYEIQAAALRTIRDQGQRFRVVVSSQPILDLSSRVDVAPVERALAELEIQP